MKNPYDWFQSPLGHYLLEREQACFDRMVADIFGFNAVQLGLPQVDFLRKNRIPFHFTAGSEALVQLQTDFSHLAIASQSVDLMVLPHVLEFNTNSHQVLREVERVLMPEGHVVISGFNPWSMWGAWHLVRKSRNEYPWCGKFISLIRLKDWLALLGLEVIESSLCCYAPPVNSEGWLSRMQFMEPAGDRWWAMGGGIYFIRAKKRVHSMRVIMPRWQDKIAREKALAPATQQVVNFKTQSHELTENDN